MVQGTTKLSFVQTRGSVPVFWAEINTLRYKPDLLIMDREDSVSSIEKVTFAYCLADASRLQGQALELHLSEQLKTYGPQTLVNLVKQKGHEKPVKEAFEKRVAEVNLKDVNYEYFDFAHECKSMKFENVKILVDRLRDVFPTMG